MRTILLSFKPNVFNKICLGEKIYEHRKVFPNEPIEAYIYISKPVQAIKGILYLDNKTELKDWKERYKNDIDAINRINKYLENYEVVMEIQKFQNTSKISLEEIRKEFPNFIIPQMYYYLDEKPLLKYLKENLQTIGEPIVHSFDDIKSNMICIN